MDYTLSVSLNHPDKQRPGLPFQALKTAVLHQDFIQQAHIHHNLDIFPYTSKGEIYYQF